MNLDEEFQEILNVITMNLVECENRNTSSLFFKSPRTIPIQMSLQNLHEKKIKLGFRALE